MIEERRKLVESLLENVNKRNWEGIVEMCSKDPRGLEEEISERKETVLHLGVIENQEERVEELMNIIISIKKEKEIGGKKNDRKNTALHCAASMGSMSMCNSIASADQFLVDIKNENGETPLYSAAFHGHTDVFLCLYSFCSSDFTRIEANCRRNDGDSVLHCAIRNEHFGLAFQILHLNNDIGNWMNVRGVTPLHILANKSTAFKSGTHIGGWKKIIYFCIFVDDVKPEWTNSNPRQFEAAMAEKMSKVKPNKFSTSSSSSYPANYSTFICFFKLLWNFFLIVTNLKSKRLFNKGKSINAEKEAMKIDDAEFQNVEQDGIHDETIETTNPIQRNNSKDYIIFPENYATCINFAKLISSAILLFVYGIGSIEMKKIREQKENHTWSIQVMKKLLEHASPYTYSYDGTVPMSTRFTLDDATIDETRPYFLQGDKVDLNIGNLIEDTRKIADSTNEFIGISTTECIPDILETSNGNMTVVTEDDVDPTRTIKETPILIAAKNGVVEMVEKIYELFPMAIHDINEDNKNAVLLAAEYRQPHVYTFLLKKRSQIEDVFRKKDGKGNTALHLAANLVAHEPWRIQGAALQMLWELKWYQYVKDSMPLQYLTSLPNDGGEIPEQIFQNSHKKLVENGGKWLTKTSKSCSVVAALITSVAFTTSTTVPGGNHQVKGTPLRKDEPAFMIFSISSLLALCFSVTSLVTFLSILTLRMEATDFKSGLHWKILLGLSSLLFSIVAMLVSFCAGHYFQLNHMLRFIFIPGYVIICLLVAFIYLSQKLSLYIDIIMTIITKVPKRSFKNIISN